LDVLSSPFGPFGTGCPNVVGTGEGAVDLPTASIDPENLTSPRHSDGHGGVHVAGADAG
jgi:hypothetical protein